jgi:hypothetical protein
MERRDVAGHQKLARLPAACEGPLLATKRTCPAGVAMSAAEGETEEKRTRVDFRL